MRIINNSAPAEYYSQRNNARRPFGACNVESFIDAAVAAKWTMPAAKPGEYAQLGDRLMWFIETDRECLDLWRSEEPRGERRPNEIMSVLTLGFNRWMGQIISQWTDSAEIPRMIGQLAQGGTCVVCGDFPRVGGHVVPIIGVAFDESEGGYPIPRYWIIDDPYGNYRTNYESERGDDVEMPHEDFLRILKPQGAPRKWCHFIRPFQADGGTI